MADSITIYEPKITAVTVSPNPVNALGALTIRATVEEIAAAVLTPDPWRGGEIYAGEG